MEETSMFMSEQAMFEIAKSRQRAILQEAAINRLRKQIEEQNRTESGFSDNADRSIVRLSVPAMMTIATISLLVVALAYFSPI
jgi:hypothetical protein